MDPLMELKQKRTKLLDRAEALLEGRSGNGQGVSPEVKREFDSLMDEVDGLDLEIKMAERGSGGPDNGAPPRPYPDGQRGRQEAEGPLLVTPDGKEIRAILPEQRFADHVDYQLPDGIKARELSTGRAIRAMLTGDWTGAEAEYRVMGTTTDPGGGYLLGDGMSSRIIDLARSKAALIRAGALTVPMDTKTLSMARVTGDPTAEWKGEGDLGTESDVTLGELELEAKTLIGLTRVNQELIEDAGNSGDLVEQVLSDVLALELDRAGLFGDGTSTTPIVGLMNDPDLQSIAHSAALSNYDVFSNAVEDVQTQNGIAQAAILHPRDLGALDRLKDTTNQPLKPPSSWEDLRKVDSTQIETDQGGGTESTAFVGDFSQVFIGMRKQIRIEATRVADDAFQRYQVLIRGVLRADVVTARPDHIVRVTGITP